MLMYWKNRAVNGAWKLQRRVYEVLRNEDGVGTVEVVLLILVATGLVLIFKDRGRLKVKQTAYVRNAAAYIRGIRRGKELGDE